MNDPITTQDKLAQMFANMGAALEARSAKLLPEIGEAPVLGPCPSCKKTITALDREASEEESVRENRVVLVYGVCDDCEVEARVKERMARYGVPARVRHATLENFQVSSPAMEEAVTSVRRWVRDPESLFLLLLGKCGTGKGHLAAAAIRESGAGARWTTHADLVNEYHSLPLNDREAYRRRFLRYTVLVIDEMGAKSMTADTPELFFGLLNLRHDRGLKTVLIGNIPLKAAEGKPSVLAILGEDRAESRLFNTATTIFPRWEDWRRTHR